MVSGPVLVLVLRSRAPRHLGHRLTGTFPFAPNAVPWRFSNTTSSGLGPANAAPARPSAPDDPSRRASSSLAALARAASGACPAGLAIALESDEANMDGGARSEGAAGGAGSGSGAGGGGGAAAREGVGLETAGAGAEAAAFLAAAAACILSCSLESGLAGLVAGAGATVGGTAGVGSGPEVDGGGGTGWAIGAGSRERSAICVSSGAADNEPKRAKVGKDEKMLPDATGTRRGPALQ